MGTLYYGDNLDILRRYLKDESVDLVYLDPPFNSAQNYNAFFHEKDGTEAASQIRAFEDTWSWNQESQKVYEELILQPGKVSEVMQAFHTFLGTNDMMAYLAMMAPRLVELRRVLKPTGSLYLHCDPTASHYLKLLCDAVFGGQFFRNEVIWQRTSAHNDPQRYGRVHDTILFYTRSESFTWNTQFDKPDEKYFEAHDFERDEKGRLYRKRDLTAPSHGHNSGQYEWKGKRPPEGRMWSYTLENMSELEREGRIVYTKTGMPRLKIYADDLKGVSLQDVWTRPDLWLNSAAKERLGYPTQKPTTLLERILSTSSNPGDLILDPFCGCGTTIDAAEKLGRKWIGIDITQLAVTLIKNRLLDTYGSRMKFVSGAGSMSGRDAFHSVPDSKLKDGDAVESVPTESIVRIIGEPVTPNEASILAEQDKYQFQWWALGLVGARPVEQKKGADHGIDGKILFRDDLKAARPEQIIIQVKGGKASVDHVRDLRGVLEREKAAMGVLITLQPPTKPMEVEAASAGFYEHKLNGQKYPRVQLRTVKELMEGKAIERPSSVAAVDETFRKAPKPKAKGEEQRGLSL